MKVRDEGSNHGFNGGGAEIPLRDLAATVIAVVEQDLLDVATVTGLIAALSASRDRLNGSPSLRSLLDRVTDENRHAEVQTGPAVGKEVW